MVRLDDPNLGSDVEREDLPRMSFGDHLEELRKRLIISLIAVFVVVLVVMPFKTAVLGIIVEPYRVAWRGGFVEWVHKLEQQKQDATIDKEGVQYLDYCLEYRDAILSGTKNYSYNLQAKTGFPVPYGLVALKGFEDIFTWMWAALVFALVLAAPIVAWQMWAFIAAGLYKHERRVFYRFFPFMMVLFAGGVMFGYFVALPFSLRFLIGMMDPSQTIAMLSISQFLDLELLLTSAMGLVFELPLVMMALQKVGLVTHQGFRKNWRMIVIIIFVIAALLTPPDPFSMLMMATPMLLLFGLGLLLTWFRRGSDAAIVEVAP